MKIAKTAIVSIFILCSHSLRGVQHNYFLLTNDTLVIETKKEKGFGLFLDLASGGSLSFYDSTVNHGYHVVFPVNITNIKLASVSIDFKPNYYEKYKAGNCDTLQFLKWISEKKIDTLNIPSIKDNSLSILCGLKDGQKIYMIDENNNKDFRDDSIRSYKKNPFESITKIKFKIFSGQGIIEDSSWCSTPSFDGSNLSFFVFQHLESTFNIAEKKYKIGVVGIKNSRFAFDNPIISLISDCGIEKDKLLNREFIEKGEYLKIGSDYFLFADISNDGKNITLIKDKNFEQKVGTQFGMIAPEFKIKSTDATIIESKAPRKKLLLLANISACNPDSYDSYNKLVDAKKEQIDIIGIEYGLSKKLNGIMIDTKDNFNQEFYNDFRKEWSDYNCYLIDIDGRIIQKFDISDWESSLLNY